MAFGDSDIPFMLQDFGIPVQLGGYSDVGLLDDFEQRDGFGSVDVDVVSRIRKVEVQSGAAVTTPFRRASTATYTDVNGIVQTAGVDVLRNANYANGVLLPPLIEAAAVNSVRNPGLAGSVPGTPGTLPTNWSIANLSGLSTQVVGSGSEFGLAYVDVRFFGTANSTLIRISYESSLFMVAANGQTWTTSFYSRLSAGTLNGVLNIYSTIAFRNVGNSILSQLVGAKPALSAAIARASVSLTASDPTTAFVSADFRLDLTNGAAIDFTLRFYGPQVEQSPAATSFIPTGQGARAADIDQMFAATATGYSRQIGSFLTEGFKTGRKIKPVGFVSNPQSVITDVTELTVTVSDRRSAEAAVAGRSLYFGLPGLKRGSALTVDGTALKVRDLMQVGDGALTEIHVVTP